MFDRAWGKVCTVEPIAKSEADFMIQQHYLKCWPAVCVCRLGLRVSGRWAGLIIFSLPRAGTEKLVGGITWELARLWAHDDMPRNTESWFISKAVKWVRMNRPEVRFLISYADPSAGHHGFVYKASNWKDFGRSDEGRMTPRFDHLDPQTGKKYERRSRIPEGVQTVRLPRVSKHRFVYEL